MAQNPHNAFIHLGHQNGSSFIFFVSSDQSLTSRSRTGTVSLWSPSVSKPQVQLQAHRGPVSSIALDPSTLGTRMVTTGVDGTVKVWDTRKWAVLNEYQFKKTPKTAAWSQKGLLGLGWGNHVSVRSKFYFPLSNSSLTRSCPIYRSSRTFSDRVRILACRHRPT